MAGLKRYRPHILVLGVLAAVLLSGMHGIMRNTLTDMRFRWLPHQASGAIVLVAIDSPSIAKIGVWPWPRQLHAKLIERLEQAGATDIVFDVDFSSASNDEADKAFERGLAKGRRLGGVAGVQAACRHRRQRRRQSMSASRCRSSSNTPGRRSSMSRSSLTVWCGITPMAR